MSRSKKVQPAPRWKVYVSFRKPDSFQGTANRPGKAGSNPRFVQETCLGRTKKAQGGRGRSLRARARTGVQAGRPARLCLRRSSGTRQPSRPSGHRDPPATRERPVPRQGPARVPESSASRGNPPPGYWHSEGGTEPNSAFCLVEPSGSLTGHSEAPAPIRFPKSPHLERS